MGILAKLVLWPTSLPTPLSETTLHISLASLKTAQSIQEIQSFNFFLHFLALQCKFQPQKIFLTELHEENDSLANVASHPALTYKCDFERLWKYESSKIKIKLESNFEKESSIKWRIPYRGKKCRGKVTKILRGWRNFPPTNKTPR